jgi:HrpA-like RNA helicase
MKYKVKSEPEDVASSSDTCCCLPDENQKVKLEPKSEVGEDVASSGTCYGLPCENQKANFEPKSEVGRCSGTQDFPMDVKHNMKLSSNDKLAEISTGGMHVTRRANNDVHVEPGPSSCGQSAADRYSHISESSFKRKFLQNITGNIEANLERSLLVGTSLTQDKELDKVLKVRLLAKENGKHYQRMREFRQKLPTFGMKDKILQLVEQNQIIVISGETGNNSINHI